MAGQLTCSTVAILSILGMCAGMTMALDCYNESIGNTTRTVETCTGTKVKSCVYATVHQANHSTARGCSDVEPTSSNGCTKSLNVHTCLCKTSKCNDDAECNCDLSSSGVTAHPLGPLWILLASCAVWAGARLS